MAYDSAGLRGAAYGGGIGGGAGSAKMLYHYATNDAAAAVEAAGYFNAAPLNTGDVIIASMDVDGAVVGKIYICQSGDGQVGSAKTVELFATT